MARSSVVRVALASFIGTTIEWYDFFLYGTAAALVLNRAFFPTFDPVTGTMAAFGTYAVGFVARPLGGAIFGHFGDRVGRKSMLVTTLLIMGLSTFAIGLLPGYARLGPVAPALLITLRFLQGLGVGGEWGGAVLMASEHSDGRRRGFFASWPQAGVPMGLLLASLVFAACARLPEPAFLAWGWRLPFLGGAALVAVGLFIRMHVLESPEFAQLQRSGEAARAPLVEVLRNNGRVVILAAGSRLAENAWFYIFSVFVLSYTTQQLRLPRAVALHALLVACAIELVTLPLFGAASDRFGRRPVYLFGTVFSALFALPAFWLMDTGTTGVTLAIVVALNIAHAAMYGPQAAFFAEQFGTRVRYSGASIGYQLASVFSGGLAPLVATALLGWSGGRPWPVAVYLISMAALSVFCITRAAETAPKPAIQVCEPVVQKVL